MASRPVLRGKEDARLALRDVVHVENLFGVVAEWLGGNGVKMVEAEEGRDEEDGEKKDKTNTVHGFHGFF